MEKIIKSFEDLDVYKKSYNLAIKIHKFSLSLPKQEQYGLGDQIRRASKSICANLAEGFAKQRKSSPEFRRYISMALGSSDEMKVWLSFCCDLGYMNKKHKDLLKDEYVIVSKMLNGLSNKWK